MDDGVWRRPSAYSSEPDCFTRDLIEDGRKHLLLGGMICTGAPTRCCKACGMKMCRFHMRSR